MVQIRTEARCALRRGLAVVSRAKAVSGTRGRRLVRRSRALPAQITTLRRRPAVRIAASGPPTDVDRYWSRHLVRSEPFASARESEEYLEWRFAEYPRYRELMQLWGTHDDDVVLDYGCGPANDIVGFLLHTRARRVIGVDVSSPALRLARQRIALHRVDPQRVELVHISDADAAISLPDESVDFIHCSGVLHHTTDPEATLRELHRVLRPGGRGNIMVYNRRSLWFHLYVAYVLRVLGGDDAPIEDVFRRSTDGPECPISIAYEPAEFVSVLGAAGFDARFVGGYLSRHELEVLERYGEAARNSEQLGAEHRTFLERVNFAADGLPELDGLGAGIGGVYRIRKG